MEMLRGSSLLRRSDENEIAVCGYTSDSGGKNLQLECYAIKFPNPDPDPDPDPDPYPSPYQYSDDSSSIGKMKINPSIRKKQIDLSSSAKEKEKVKINPPSAKANEKETIDSVVRMRYRSTQHAFPNLSFFSRSGFTYLFSLGGLDPVGSNSDGGGAHPFESEKYLKMRSLNVNKPDAGWEAVPPMYYPNRYNPRSVALRDKLIVLGGFSRSQFPAKGYGWMEVYQPYLGWIPVSNPPCGFSFNDDPLIFTTYAESKILLAQYNHDDMNCDSATFYDYDLSTGYWTTLHPVRKLLARYPDRTGRRSVAVGNTLYWGLFEDEDIKVQAYDLSKDIWFHGSFNIRPVLGKDEFVSDNVFPASPPLLHLADQKFCLFLLTSIYDEKNCEVSNPHLIRLILDISLINDEVDNHQHDYYDHFCGKVSGDVNVDDKEDNANYHVHPHDHFWRLSISIVSIQKCPLVNPIQLLDAVVLLREVDRTAVTVGPGMDLPIMHDINRNKLVRDIKSGNFRVERLRIGKQTDELDAVKYIERGEKIDENVQREIINHRSLRHPNIVRFKEVILTPTHLAIVMEYASGGELFERICNAGRFSEDEARFFFQQLISGVSYCHAMQVCHRDLKLENTLLDGSPAPHLKICDFGYSKQVCHRDLKLENTLLDGSPAPHLKICDFGYSKSSVLHSQPKSTVGTPAYIAPEVLLKKEYDGKSSVLHSQPKSTVGTPAYNAPEVLLKKEYDGKIADVWSCGVTLYVMLVGAYPFEDPEDPKNFRKTIQRILAVQYSIPQNVLISPECRHLISRIFVADPAKRISIPEIRNHEWFLKNLPADLMDERTMNNQFEEPDQPMQSIDEIMQIIAEATIPAAGTPSLSQYLTGSLDLDEDMEEDLETDPDLDIDSSGEIIDSM